MVVRRERMRSGMNGGWRVFGAGLLLALQAGCVDPAVDADRAQTEEPVVYGQDNRVEVYAHPDAAWRTLARRSIAVMVENSVLDTSNSSNIQLEGQTLGSAYGLCTDQRFREQPTAGSCSATLVDRDLVLTAGHCVTSQSDCNGVSFVFDYFYEAAGRLATVSSDDVYRCRQIVARAQADSGADYAVIRLDRAVVGDRVPAQLRRETGALALNSGVSLVGFPTGLPLKLSPGGVVHNNRSAQLDYFEATVDAFGGNSGSGVFNDQMELVGILVRGETDYVRRGSCSVVNVLADSAQGEDITYVGKAIAAVCNNASNTGVDIFCNRASTGTPDAGDTCAAPVRLDPVSQSIDGTFGPVVANDAQGSCGGAGFDHVYQFTLAERRHLLASVTGSVSSALYLRRQTCSSTAAQVACTTSAGADLDSVLEAGTYYLFVDAMAANTRGTYQVDLLLEAVSPTCESTCTVGQALCDPAGLLSCVADATGCATWSSPVACPAGQTCSQGACGAPVCQDACTLGQLRCEGAGAQRCELGAQGCTQWTATQACAAGQTCQAGVCQASAARGETCADALPVASTTQRLTGTLTGFANDMKGSCAGNGPEKVFSFDLDRVTQFTATASGMDTVLYLTTNCSLASAQLACNDDSTPPGSYGSYLNLELQPGHYLLVLDSYRNAGNYTLDLAFTATAACQDVCTAGQLRCADQGVQRCELAASGCLAWSVATACAAGQTCSAGICQSPQGNGETCEAAQWIQPVSQRVQATVVGFANDLRGSCGGGGAERVYAFTLPQSAQLTAIATGFDTVLYLTEDCADLNAELACNDDATPPGSYGSSITADLAAGSYFLVVDGYNRPGAFTLDLQFE